MGFNNQSFGIPTKGTDGKQINIDSLTRDQKRIIYNRFLRSKGRGNRNRVSKTGFGYNSEINDAINKTGSELDKNVYGENPHQRHKLRSIGKAADERQHAQPLSGFEDTTKSRPQRNSAVGGAGDGGVAPTGPGVGPRGMFGVLTGFMRSAVSIAPFPYNIAPFLIDTIFGLKPPKVHAQSYENDPRDLVKVIRDEAEQDPMDSIQKSWHDEESAFNQNQMTQENIDPPMRTTPFAGTSGGSGGNAGSSSAGSAAGSGVGGATGGGGDSGGDGSPGGGGGQH